MYLFSTLFLKYIRFLLGINSELGKQRNGYIVQHSGPIFDGLSLLHTYLTQATAVLFSAN